MYEYQCVPVRNSDGFMLSKQDFKHREIIPKMAAEGWRFVSAIPTASGPRGDIVSMDLIFERETVDTEAQ